MAAKKKYREVRIIRDSLGDEHLYDVQAKRRFLWGSKFATESYTEAFKKADELRDEVIQPKPRRIRKVLEHHINVDA